MTSVRARCAQARLAVLAAASMFGASTLAASMLAACSGREGLDVATLPVDVRPDYQVFAHRCSKCHSLARPLQSGITSDTFWVEYVARMRRQPGSGITLADTEPILRFLHYYSTEQKQKQGGAQETPETQGARGDGG